MSYDRAEWTESRKLKLIKSVQEVLGLGQTSDGGFKKQGWTIDISDSIPDDSNASDCKSERADRDVDSNPSRPSVEAMNELTTPCRPSSNERNQKRQKIRKHYLKCQLGRA